MGLDMYLSKETFIWDNDNRKNLKISGKEVEEIKPERVSTIIEDVGYWRNATHIHKWFVDNVQNGVDECQKSYVAKENLTDLLTIVKKVLTDQSLASELLPVASICFFGSTAYDAYYFSSLEETVKILETAIKEKNGDLYYTSSW